MRKQEDNPMTKMQKSIQALKAEDFKPDDVVIEEGRIVGLEDLETEYGQRYVLKFSDRSDDVHSVFLNTTSKDNLIDGFGDESDDWVDQKIKITCTRGTGKYKNKMLVVEAL